MQHKINKIRNFSMAGGFLLIIYILYVLFTIFTSPALFNKFSVAINPGIIVSFVLTTIPTLACSLIALITLQNIQISDPKICKLQNSCKVWGWIGFIFGLGWIVGMVFICNKQVRKLGLESSDTPINKSSKSSLEENSKTPSKTDPTVL